MHDLLGITTEFQPRFLAATSISTTRSPAPVRQYIHDVKAKDFPNDLEQY